MEKKRTKAQGKEKMWMDQRDLRQRSDSVPVAAGLQSPGAAPVLAFTWEAQRGCWVYPGSPHYIAEL